MTWVVSIVVGESGKTEDEVVLMQLRKVFAYEHCYYAKKGIKCRPMSDGDTLESLMSL